MKKPVWKPLMTFGLVWLFVVLVSWFAFPDWQKIPGGFWTLAGLAAVGALAFLKDGVSYIKTFLEIKPEDKQPGPPAVPQITSSGSDAQNAIGTGARNIKPGRDYIEKIEHYHPAPAAEEPAPTTLLGMIPPAHADKYIQRGEIEQQVRAALRGNGVAAIVGLHAPGGTGKSELANQLSREMQAQFENTLWVDIGEKTADQVVGDMLRGCGLKPPETYPAQVHELKAYLAARRLLVVLDDLRSQSKDKLSDFLPPAPPCAVMITSRIEQPSHLIPLKNTFELNRMTPAQAHELLEATLGGETVAAELKMAEQLAERCLWNPLALEIAARRIRQMQGFRQPIQKYLEKLNNSLAELKMPDDPRLNMEKVFDQSYDDLNPDDQARFAALSVFAPSGFCPQAAAQVWQEEPAAAGEALLRLKNLSLVKTVPGESERYRLHDLLDEYASQKLKNLANQSQAYENMAGWLTRLFEEHYADDFSNAPEVALELDNLLRAIDWASASKRGTILALLATRPRNWLFNYWRKWEDWQAWLETALRLGIDDKENEGKQLKANVLKAIGDVQNFRKEMDAALESYQQALGLFRAVGDRLGEANVLKAIGDVQNFRDERDAALESYQQALGLFRAVGARLGEANVLSAIGQQEIIFGSKEKAQDLLKNAINIYTTIGDRYSVPAQIGNFGWVLIRAGRKEEARPYLLQAAELFEKIGLPDYAERHRKFAK